MTVITEVTRTKLRTAFLSPDLHLGRGLGSATGERCTIAEVNLVLTGELTADSHPCISEVIRKWVIRIQDKMPDEMRNSVAWREAAVGIAGSAASVEVERRRVTLILDWMWNALGDDAVLAQIPQAACEAWDRMLTERTYGAARAAYYAAAVYATAVSNATVAAYYAARAADHVSNACGAVEDVAKAVARVAYIVSDKDAYWDRRNPAALLASLIEIQ